MYDQPNSMIFMQKKQLTWLLAMVFAVVVSAITFSAFLINTFLKGQVASAVSQVPPAVVKVIPASVTSTTTGCTVPEDQTGGMGGGESAAAMTSNTTAFAGGMGAGTMTWMMPAGGMGAPATNSTVNNMTTKTVTKNVNSGNTIGSNNGSNNTTSTTSTSTITNTDSYNQGSYNTASAGSVITSGPNTNTGMNTNTTSNETTSSNSPEVTSPVTDSFNDSHDETSNATNISDNTVVLPLSIASLE
jgi:hypothetical protein